MNLKTKQLFSVAVRSSSQSKPFITYNGWEKQTGQIPCVFSRSELPGWGCPEPPTLREKEHVAQRFGRLGARHGAAMLRAKAVFFHLAVQGHPTDPQFAGGP
jgi:hypothetical protein